MESLISWKKKRDKYRGEYADDDTDVIAPRLTDTLNEVVFIRRDEVNAKAMRKMGIKW